MRCLIQVCVERGTDATAFGASFYYGYGREVAIAYGLQWSQHGENVDKIETLLAIGSLTRRQRG
jgi:hypothetical protein